jgi:hypothetical protein
MIIGRRSQKLRQTNLIHVGALLATCFHVDFLLSFLFDTEDGDDIFLRNVG